MKILSLTHKPPYPPKDGGAIGILNIAIGIARNGNSIHVLSMNTSKHKVTEDEMPKDICPGLSFSFVNVDTSIKLLKALYNLLFSDLPYSAERFVSKEYLNELIKTLQHNDYDLLVRLYMN